MVASGGHYMPSDNIVTLVASGLAFLASIIAVIVSAYNARFARFASEKWWERKAEAYTRIIGALSDLVYYYGRIYDAETQARDLSDLHSALL
jgi:ABC-type arginine transport system permease subunit